MESKRDQLKLLGKAFYDRKKEEVTSPASNDDIESLRQRVEQLEQLCLIMTELLSSENKDDIVLDRSLLTKDLETAFISTEKIDQFVEELLADNKTNIGLIPDFIERKLDRRILILVLGVIVKFIKTTSVEVADGRRLTLTLKPKEEVIEKEEEKEKSRNPKQLDNILFKAVADLLATVKVDFLSHELGFKFE